MICKGYIPQIDHINNKTQEVKRKNLCRNRVYTVSLLSTKQVTLIDKNKDVTIRIPKAIFDEHFDLPYCTTTHSAIGLTIDKPITIFDWNSQYASKEWFWTAITRTTSLSLISFYEGPELIDEEGAHEQLLEQIRTKLVSHKSYDKQHDMYEDKHFVTEEWVIEELERTHWICPEQGCEIVQHSGNRQWSIDRIDNDLGHTIHNCRIICVSCNKGKH